MATSCWFVTRSTRSNILTWCNSRPSSSYYPCRPHGPNAASLRYYDSRINYVTDQWHRKTIGGRGARHCGEMGQKSVKLKRCVRRRFWGQETATTTKVQISHLNLKKLTSITFSSKTVCSTSCRPCSIVCHYNVTCNVAMYEST